MEKAQKEREIIAKNVYSILLDLNKHFPWAVIEIIISLHDRIGKENSFVSQVTHGILDKETEAKLDDYLPECTGDTSTPTAEFAKRFYEGKLGKVIASFLPESAFGLNAQAKEECLPWDLAEQPISFDTLGDEKSMAIKNIKMKLRELAMLRGIVARNSDECGTECIAIDTIFEILNFSIV